jgi:hypothetical protein
MFSEEELTIGMAIDNNSNGINKSPFQSLMKLLFLFFNLFHPLGTVVLSKLSMLHTIIQHRLTQAVIEESLNTSQEPPKPTDFQVPL